MIYMTYRLELGPVVVVGEMSPSFVVSKDQMLNRSLELVLIKLNLPRNDQLFAGRTCD